MPSTGSPALNTQSGARGVPNSVTLAGPPDRITALGLQALEGVLGAVERHDLGVDALLAHAPGDQLRHLAAEIDDEDGVGHEPPAESGCTGMGR